MQSVGEIAAAKRIERPKKGVRSMEEQLPTLYSEIAGGVLLLAVGFASGWLVGR